MARLNSDKMMSYRIYDLSTKLPLSEVAKLFLLPEELTRARIAEGKKLLIKHGEKCSCGRLAILQSFRGKEVCDACMNHDEFPALLEDHSRHAYSFVEDMRSKLG
jgi:hypothetical protein